MRKIIQASTLALMLLPVASVAQDLDAGVRAAQSGDFETALENWRPLADQGDARAQYRLGNMYWRGDGVPKDNDEAVRWFRLAAEQGHSSARIQLENLFAPALETEIVHVWTGCYWESDEMDGQYRFIVTERGWEHRVTFLYFQWISHELASDGPVVKIVAEATISELNDNFYVFDLPEFVDDACQELSLSVTHTYTLEEREMEIRIGDVGVVTANWR